MSIPTKYAIVVVFGLAQYGALSHQREEPHCRSDGSSAKVADHWVEESTWNPGIGYTATCRIYRKQDNPAIVVQHTSVPAWGLQRHVPFLLVIDVNDSMRALTDFRIGSPAIGLSTVGRFRSEGGAIGKFTHSYEIEENAEGDLEVAEWAVWGIGVDEKRFKVENGRVFVARFDISDGQFHIVQLDCELPREALMDRLSGIDGESIEATDLLFEWWRKAGLNLRKSP